MAKHNVKFSLPSAELKHADVEFVVYSDGSLFGKLLVSKGAVVWRPRSKSWRGKKMGWHRFSVFMQTHGRSEH